MVGGWKGILFANYAIVNPVAAWEFFVDPAFDASWLDGGASRTWYLAFAAGESCFFFILLSSFLPPFFSGAFIVEENWLMCIGLGGAP